MTTYILKKLNMTTKEFGERLLVVTVLAFCFSFRDWGDKFSWMIGTNNFMTTLFVVAISMFVHDLAHKIVAKKHGATTEFKMWTMGLFIAIILAFVTNGYFVFAAAWTVSITSNKLLRSKYKYSEMGPYENAKIALSGPMASLFLAIFASMFFQGSYFFSKLVYVNAWIAIFNLVPFFSLIFASYTFKGHTVIKSEIMPRLEGEWVFFGSRSLWFFSFSFALVCGLSLMLFGSGISLVIGVICGVAMYLSYHYFSMTKWS